MMRLQAQVAHGMAFLDKHYPGHVERFNPDIFNIGRPSVCALAQAAEKSWYDALRDLYGELDDWTDTWLDLEGMGFLASGDVGNRLALNQAWIDAYAVRKAALVQAPTG